MYLDLSCKVMPLNERGPVSKRDRPPLLGLNGFHTGDVFNVMEMNKKKRCIKRTQHKETVSKNSKHVTLDEIGRRIAFRDFNIIVGDVDGLLSSV